MAKHAVTRMLEVDYRNMSKRDMSKIWRCDDLLEQQNTTCFDSEDDYFALYENPAADACDYNDDRAYAVYLHSSDELLCLLPDVTVALNGCGDANYFHERAYLYKQIAMAAGWPEKAMHGDVANLTDKDMELEDFQEGYDSWICPVCNVEFDRTDGNTETIEDANTCYLHQTCPNCGSEWTSYFHFHHLHIFKDGRFVKEV